MENLHNNWDSINNGNLKRVDAVDSYMHIPLALITSSNCTNLGNFIFGAFVSIIYFGVLILNVTPQCGGLGTRTMGLDSAIGLFYHSLAVR